MLVLSACKNDGGESEVKAPEGVYGTINMNESFPPETKDQSRGTENKNTAGEKANNLRNRQLTSLSDDKIAFYDTQGKVDPFISLVREKKADPLPASSGQKRPARVLTPLEKIDLEHLRLTAIVIMKNKRMAIVEEPTGKGYEITIGTYIGKNQGRVSRINERSIQVSERIKDHNGNMKDRLVEKKLYKYEYEE